MKKQIDLLVVDDDDIYLFLIKSIVRRLPYSINVMTATNGEVALSLLGDSEPDLILLDINMPVMNGWKFIETANDKLKRTTVYIVTSSIDPEDKDQAKENRYVKGFIEKPITQEALNEIILEI